MQHLCCYFLFSKILALIFPKFNPESRAFTDFRTLYKYLSAMIRFDNTFYQRQSQSPTTFFSRIARIEYGFELGLGDSLSRIGAPPLHLPHF